MLAITSPVFADKQQVDNDLASSGLQNNVNLSALPSATVNTSGQIVIEWSGNNHLSAGTVVTFQVDATQTTLPTGYSVSSLTLTVPSPWDTNEQQVAGWSEISFTAPTASGSYSYTVKWETTIDYGNKLTGGPAFTINLTVTEPSDNMPPIVNVNFPAPDGLAGWFVAKPVTGTVIATDPSNVTAITVIGATLSGVTGLGTPNASGTLTISAEGINTITATATDGVGNSGVAPGSSNTATVKIDTIPPVVTATAAPLPNVAGWNNTNVTVTFTATDVSGSGVAMVDSPVTVTTEGAGQVITGSAKDVAGNTGTGSIILNIDKTPPVVTINGPPVVLQGTSASATVRASDGLSGLAIDPSGSVVLDTSTPGTKTVTATAVDRAGNSATASLTYTVWGVIGPFPPLQKNGNGIGQFKTGSTIPVKFQLTDGTNLISTATGSVSIGSASAAFRWDNTAQQYVANVKTATTDVEKTLPVVLTVTGAGSKTLIDVTLK